MFLKYFPKFVKIKKIPFKLYFCKKMEKTKQTPEPRRVLYEFKQPHKTGFIKAGSIHNLYWEVSGKEGGKPVIVLHGGPGGGCVDFYRGYFDPEVYEVVMFDQRGAGRSEPHACLEENTTWDLVSDIELIRNFLKIEKWHTVFGGSWGSTLSLSYAQTHPERVGHLVLRGIFLLRRKEIQFFYQEGSSWLFPEYHEELRNLLPEVERDDILTGYWRRLNGKDEAEKLKFAKAWTKWEMATSKLFVDPENIEKGEEDKFALAFARIETHYFINGGFFEKVDQLLENCDRIKDIPTEIVQGRYDVVCPALSAYDLKKRLNKANLHMIADAGHSCSEPGIVDALVRATDKFKNENI
jgi:proline iminopeptidase